MPEAPGTPKLAVILPAYNAEEHIREAVESVLCQNVRDLELIVVDDGSADGTAARLSQLAAADKRLRWIRTANAGPAAARNRGLNALRPGTEYVMFLDADDVLLPGAAERALRAAKSGAELVVFGYTIRDAAGGESRYGEPKQLLRETELAEAFPRLYKANLLSQAWGKLYRAELLAGLRFPDCRWGEDRLFLFDLLERAKTVAILPESGYEYRMQPGESLVSRYWDGKFSVCLEADRKALSLCRADAAALRYMFAKSVFSCITTLFVPSCPLSRVEKRAAVREILANDRVRQRCRDTFGGLPTEALCAVLRSGSVALNLLSFRAVALAGVLAPGLFIKLKHRK